MYHIKQWSVIFVNQDNHLPLCLLISSFNQVPKSNIRCLSRLNNTILVFILRQLITQEVLQLLFIHVLPQAHVKPNHRIRSPLSLQLLNGQSLEKLLTPLEVALQCRKQQRLPEATRTTQKIIFRGRICQLIDKCRLIHIKIILRADLRKGLNAHRAKSQCLFHDLGTKR